MANLEFPSIDIHLDGYSQRNFIATNSDFASSPQEVVLSRIVNNLLAPFGDDCIIKGLQVIVSNTTTNVKFQVKSGLAIADSTLIEIPSINNVDLDVITPGYSSAGYVICYLNYKYPTTLSTMRASLRVRYVSSDGLNVYPDDWVSNEVRIILGVAKFSVANGVITDAWSVANSDGFTTLTIKGKTFTVQKMNRFILKFFENPYQKVQDVKITQTHLNNGYITLNYWPRSFEVVDGQMISGISLINNNALSNAGLIPTLNYKGEWSIETVTYYYNDVVDYNDRQYRCKVTHKNDGKYEPGLIGGDWVEKWEILNILRGDFAIYENKFIIKNGTYQSSIGDDPLVATNLSEEFNVGDNIIIEYIY